MPPSSAPSHAAWTRRRRNIEKLLALALFLPSLAVGVRRLHDVDRSGWWTLLALVPVVGWIVLLVRATQDGPQDTTGTARRRSPSC